jgi:subtilisin family serine protease
LRAARAFGLLACLALVVLTPSALADDAGTLTAENAGNLWFVELASPPTSEGTSEAKTKAEKAAFRSQAKKAGVKFSERYAFDKLWNGLSIKVDGGQISTISQFEGVRAVYPVETYTVPDTPSVSPELATALAMTGADVAQSSLGLSGAGVKVAVMDTGVDYDHPDLGGCFGTGCRVTTGWDFVGDAFNATTTSKSYNPVPAPDADPDDCNGHGTHVAGIVGASGNPATGGARGVAPGVEFGAYRVFGCGGSTTADIMIAAMERALEDGMQVLNMSIGSAFNTWNKYPTADASNQLVKAGMIVVASIGNSGADGVYSAGAPGVGARVIGVASFDNSHVALNTFTISPDGTSIGYGPATGAPAPPTSGTYPMARTGTTTTADDACSTSPTKPAAGSLVGKVVLIRRGTCTFYEKAFNAQAAGAEAVVLYNNAAGRFSPTVAGSPPITIPVVAISNTEGALINDRLASGPVDMTWTDDQGTFTNPTGGLISSFSSYGLAAELDLKPDIGAPGGLIRSTYPLENGGYATISGTSMSSPHVAGSVALLLEARPGMKPGAVRDLLQNTASPKNWWGNPGLGFLDNVHRQGAGMVQIDKAVLSGVTVDPGKIALGESQAGPVTKTLTFTNTGASAVTYALGRVNALSTSGSTFAPSFTTGNAAATYSIAGVPVTELTVPAGGSATVDVTITPATAPDRAQYGGYLTFTPPGDGQVLRVPYAGFVGDYQSITVLVPTANNFPRMGPHVGYTETATDWLPSYGLVAAGHTYTMQPSTHAPSGRQISGKPQVLAHFDHQAAIFRLEAYRPDGTKVGLALEQKNLPRNQTAGGFFAFEWDGKTKQGRDTWVDVPDGTYWLKVSVLKAGGDKADPAHWETRDLTQFVIDRP